MNKSTDNKRSKQSNEDFLIGCCSQFAFIICIIILMYNHSVYKTIIPTTSCITLILITVITSFIIINIIRISYNSKM